MKILLISFGTRGDCEPFLGLGELLRARGAEVVCSFPEQYRHLAEESGFAFRSLGSEFLARMDSDDMKEALGGSGLRRIAAYARLAKDGMQLQDLMLDHQRDVLDAVDPDLVIHHAKCAYVVPWACIKGRRAILFALQPGLLHEVPGLPHIGVPGVVPVSMSYRLMRKAYVQTAMSAVKRCFRGRLSSADMQRAIPGEPALFNVSSTLFPRPDSWPEHVRVAGFWARDRAALWTPSPEWTAFLARHERVLYATFGSMTNSDPAAKTALLLDVTASLKIPTIVGTAGGGLVALEERAGDDVLFVPQVPYDQALPHIHAMIHHGGAGTTHSALIAGCASMVIPHGLDQPMWSALIARVGAGPRGVPLKSLTCDNLTAALSDLWHNPRYKQTAEEIGREMRAEDSADAVFTFITAEAPSMADVMAR